MSSRVLTGPGILPGPPSPTQRGIAPVSPRATLAKPESCNFKLPRLPWLVLDKQHCLRAMPPARLFPSPLQVIHPPKPLTHCKRSCWLPQGRALSSQEQQGHFRAAKHPGDAPTLVSSSQETGLKHQRIAGKEEQQYRRKQPQALEAELWGARGFTATRTWHQRGLCST